MTKREIMVRAHEVARTMEGDYSARMVLALRQAGMRRVYFNNLVELYGLELEYYKTGNICTARLDGERISNNSARQIVSMLYNGKLWYDLTSGRFESKGLSERAVERITKALGRVA